MIVRSPSARAGATDAAVDERHMDRALQLAWRGWGRVQPNPLVGALVVDAAGTVVGEGWHAEFGCPHAEAEALDRAGAAAAGGTLYVNLEPCSHQGKTPPCTDSVLRSGVARVVVALRDPNPVAAGGLERLAAAGLDVTVGVRAREATDQNASFLHWHAHGRPFVALKYAMSLDARLGASHERPTDVTGPHARAEVHRLRAGFDAIMIGGRTALVDDPLLTVRGDLSPRRPPVRVVLDTELRLPGDARLASDTERAPTWVFAAEDARGASAPLVGRGVRVSHVRRAPDGGLDLSHVLDELGAADVRSVLCEGGGRLGSALLSAGLVARQYVFVAPVLFGEEGPPAYPDLRRPATSARWRTVRTSAFGADVLLELARA